MTREEAIEQLGSLLRLLDVITTMSSGFRPPVHPDDIVALEMSIAVLRGQESKVNQRVSNAYNALTNADHIRSMTDEELAKRSVRKTTTPVSGIDDYTGEAYTDYWDAWQTPDGAVFWSYEEAVKYELFWLKQPYKEEA